MTQKLVEGGVRQMLDLQKPGGKVCVLKMAAGKLSDNNSPFSPPGTPAIPN